MSLNPQPGKGSRWFTIAAGAVIGFPVGVVAVLLVKAVGA